MIVKLYKGSVELSFDEVKHIYSINGKRVEGVTTPLDVISKPFLLYWAVNMAIEYLGGSEKTEAALRPGIAYDELQIKEILNGAKMAHRKRKETAAERGTMIHKKIEEYIKFQLKQGPEPTPFVNPEMKDGYDRFLQWVDAKKVKFLESERLIYSKKKEYAGTMDHLTEIDGKIWFGDTKTTGAIYSSNWYQIAAYEQAYLEEFTDIKRKQIGGEVIVRIGLDGMLEIKDSTDKTVPPYKLNVAVFNNALELHRTLKEVKTYENK